MAPTAGLHHCTVATTAGLHLCTIAATARLHRGCDCWTAPLSTAASVKSRPPWKISCHLCIGPSCKLNILQPIALLRQCGHRLTISACQVNGCDSCMLGYFVRMINAAFVAHSSRADVSRRSWPCAHSLRADVSCVDSLRADVSCAHSLRCDVSCVHSLRSDVSCAHSLRPTYHVRIHKIIFIYNVRH